MKEPADIFTLEARNAKLGLEQIEGYGATAIDDRSNYDSTEYKYGYFGGQAGVGLEFRLSKVVALNFDMRGFIRSRIDDHKSDYPEFVSNEGKTTNTSGGGIFQGG